MQRLFALMIVLSATAASSITSAQAAPPADSGAFRASLSDVSDARAFRRSLEFARPPGDRLNRAGDFNLALTRRITNGGGETSIGLHSLTRNTLDPHEVNAAASTAFTVTGGGLGAGLRYTFR